ncbi:MAG: ribosomal protein S18-alanine N-acetyltransferase [Ilumatobacteraceae bacterium]
MQRGDERAGPMSVIERILRRDAEPPGDVVVESMRRRDLRRGVMDIEADAYPRPWSQGVFTSELEQARRGTRHYLVARSGREVVGYAGLWFTDGEAHVTNVAVKQSWRRQGVARRLLVALAEEARRRGCTAWTLEVRVSSTGAQELYRTFGFVPAGIRKRYYENTEDAIVMWCHDIDGEEYGRRLEVLRDGRD